MDIQETYVNETGSNKLLTYENDFKEFVIDEEFYNWIETKFTSYQQLQAKIRAIADGLEIAYRGADPMAVDNTVNELRELSAVQ